MVEANGTLVRGLTSRSGDVDMFLGIPFARVVQRFRPAQPVSLASLGPEVDATVFGPRCPQSWNHGPQRRKHLYEGIPLSSNHPVSESDCLNLNVYAPAQGKGGVDRSSLPVLVWIHGGGWVFGDGGSEYGESAFISLSLSLHVSYLSRRDIPRPRSLSTRKAVHLCDAELSAGLLWFSQLSRTSNRGRGEW